MKKILFILILALLIPFSGVSQKYVGIQSLYTNINETEEIDEMDDERGNVWLTWAKNPVKWGHAFNDEWGPFSRFEPADLAEYAGNYITKIRFRLGNQAEFWANPRVRVYVGGSVTGPLDNLEWDYGTMVVDQEVPNYTLGTNTIVDLTNPVIINGTQEIWFGVVYYVGAGFPATNVDYTVPNISYVPYKSDLVYFGGYYDEFYSLTETVRTGYSWVQAAWIQDSCEDKATNLNINYNEECHAVLTWDAPASNPTAVYTIKRVDNHYIVDVLATGYPETTFIDTNNDPVKAYTWSVTASCVSGGTSEAISLLIQACPNCSPPYSINAQYINNCAAIQIDWSASAEAHSFDIKRNSKVIKTGLTEKTYTDETVSQNVYNTYTVVANCELGNTEASKTVSPCVGILEATKMGFSIVPNPAKGNIRISADYHFDKVEIINFLGQTVISQNNDSKVTDVNVSNLTNGIYFIRIISETRISVQKFVKN